MGDCVVLVTRSVPVRGTLERVLAKAGVRVEHESCVEAGYVLARESGCILLCTAEQDWRRVVGSSSSHGEMEPPIHVARAKANWERLLLVRDALRQDVNN
jgi:hypothetical protein